MLTEARIILPTEAPGHDWLERTLIETFGGVTITNGTGAWAYGEGNIVREEITIYDVAVPVNANEALTSCARSLLERSGENAIYLRLYGGEVKIIEK